MKKNLVIFVIVLASILMAGSNVFPSSVTYPWTEEEVVSADTLLINGVLEVDGNEINIQANNKTITTTEQGSGLVGNGYGMGLVVEGSNNQIFNLSFSGFEAGVVLRQGKNNRIYNNVVSQNTGTGILIVDAHSNFVYANTCSNNSSTGIFLMNSNSNRIYSNSGEKNTQHGTVFVQSNGNYFWLNNVEGDLGEIDECESSNYFYQPTVNENIVFINQEMFPLEITSGGKYVLDSLYWDSPGYAITINTNDSVVIEGCGIWGPGGNNQSDGIFFNGDNVIIKKITLSNLGGFNGAIRGSGKITVDSCNLNSWVDTIFLTNADSSVVKNSTFSSNNPSTDASFGNYGIRLINTSNSTIVNNTMSSEVMVAVELLSASNNNNISNNAGWVVVSNEHNDSGLPWSTENYGFGNASCNEYCTKDGNSIMSIKTSVEPIKNMVSNFILNQNYPNPFNPLTTISYQLAESCVVNLTVYNITGQIVAELVNEYQKSGSHSTTFDATHLPSGIYFYKIQSRDYTYTQKMNLMK